jgi:hypothetical protein
VKIDNMTMSSLKLLLFKYEIQGLKQLLWLIGGILIEVYAQFLGAYDQRIKRMNPHIWDTATSTKNLNSEVKIKT